ncbi:hypothetical protein HK414_07095 [Ramlibacter terrae]|uniref:DUF4148 domain-containing protein n=1 Tax=Ramlibacter terrae TaxID=2732511 RepID=A0ABX6P3Z1_9BURK|nr:hypothetical protein HK414_07095 [Ramlibacter terrae]
MHRLSFSRALALVLAIVAGGAAAQDSTDPYGVNRALNLRPNMATQATVPASAPRPAAAAAASAPVVPVEPNFSPPQAQTTATT